MCRLFVKSEVKKVRRIDKLVAVEEATEANKMNSAVHTLLGAPPPH